MSLPFFPGYTFKESPSKLNRPKEHQFEVVKGLMVAKQPDPKILEQQIEAAKAKLRFIEDENEENESKYSLNETLPTASQESYVLRFFGYFKQSVVESNDENYRVRYVKIYVYLEDDTVMVEEKRFRNSGLEQGVLLRRMRVSNPKASKYGTNYTYLDFNVGIDIDIFGNVYHIFDCDSFTRTFLTDNNINVPESENSPEDLYTVKRNLTERPVRVSKVNVDKKNLKNFIENDGKVLRFYAIWDDRDKLFGELRKFIIIYFLVDGKIEIRQVLVPNSGRDNYSQFLSKTVLNKPNSKELYIDSDFYIGQEVNVFGRKFLIYDADEFTKNYCDEKFGKHDWTPLQFNDDGTYSQIKNNPPPYNGWGDEEDSLGYCYSLHPTPPKKNIVKMMNKDGQFLRFLAKFKYPSPSDQIRQFVIIFYLADDNVAVFELPKRNTGFKGGKFIQKSKFRNDNTNNYFLPNDFFIGATIKINNYIFELIDADELAFNIMESDSDNFPYSDLFLIFDQLLKNKQNLLILKKDFESIDPELLGYINKDEAIKRIVRVLKLTLHEVMTIIRRFTDEKGFNYFDFLSFL